MDDKNFSELHFPVFPLPLSADLLKQFPELRRFKAFINYPHDDRNLFIRYICFAYDPKSPIHHLPDTSELRQEAAKLAGFKRHGKGWENARLVEVLKGNYQHEAAEPVFEMIFVFITRIIHHGLWTEFCIKTHELDQMNRLRMGSVSADDKNPALALKRKIELGDLCETLREKIEALKKKLFKELRQEADYSEYRALMTPETVADKPLYFF